MFLLLLLFFFFCMRQTDAHGVDGDDDDDGDDDKDGDAHDENDHDLCPEALQLLMHTAQDAQPNRDITLL